MNIIVQNGQTIVDMALQGNGDVGQLVAIALLNGLSATDDIVVGGVIITPDADMSKRDIIDTLSTSPNYPASGDSLGIGQSAPLEGIGYWIIQLDFKVS